MWVVYLESGLAFLVGVLIVWWTWPKKRKDRRQEPQAGEPGAKDDQ